MTTSGKKRDLGFLVARLSDRFLNTNLSSIYMGPGVPLEPAAPREATAAGPRIFQYPVAVNTNTRPRGEYSLTPFDQLRSLAELYDVAAMCIAARVEQVQGLDWAITAKNKRDQQALEGEIDAVADFFKKPDGVSDFTTWMAMYLYDLFEIDAATTFLRRDLGGRLIGADVIDGATIKPLLDERGRAAGYQQILYGVPFADYMRPDLGDDMFSPDELIYRPRWPRTRTPYGKPPTEWVIMRVNMALRKQSFDMAYFTDGNVPEGFMSPLDNMDPEQVLQFEEVFNAVLAGADAARRRIKFLPWKGDFKETRPFSYDTKLDEWMMKITCAAFGVPPQELGFTNDVNKATAELQENLTYRRGLGPLSVWLKQGFDRLIPELNPVADNVVMSLPGQPARRVRSLGDLVEFRWIYGESEDRLRQAQEDQIYIAAGVVSPDEVRVMRYGDELDGPAPGPPPAPAAPAITTPDGLAQAAGLSTIPVAKAGKSGVIVGLFLPLETAGALVRQVGLSQAEPPSDLHITLAYLGKVDDARLNRDQLEATLQDFVNSRDDGPIEGVVGGVGRFNHDEGDGTNALYASYDCPELPALRQALVDALDAAGVGLGNTHGFTPHITLAYVPADMPTPDLRLPQIPVTFDRLTLAWGDERIDIALPGVPHGTAAKLAKRADAEDELADQPIDWEERERRERAAQRVFAAAYDGQMKRVQAVLKDTDPDGVPDALAQTWATEPGQMVQSVLPLFDDVASQAAQQALDVLPLGVDWEGVNQAVLQLAQDTAELWAKSATDTSQAQVSKIIADWIRTGGTMDDLMLRVARVWEGPRADVAAITEVTRLYAEGNRAAWAASGVVTMAKWQTARDEAVCPICGPKRGTTRPIDDTSGLPPAHPRCRCWITPVIRELDANA
jgi:SPP1 gp7 family putative phage head morphogenesis protein